MSPGAGALHRLRRRGVSTAKARCPREMPVSSRGARARPGLAPSRGCGPGSAPAGLPGAQHPESDPGRAWETNPGCRPSERASRLASQDRREEEAPRAGPRPGAAPGAPSQKRESASCWFMLRVPSWHLHCQDKEPVPVTSAQGKPQGDGARRKGMPGVGVTLEYTGARSRAFGSCTEKGPDPSPAAGLCLTAGP